MPRPLKNAAGNVSNAANSMARAGWQVSELIEDYRKQGEIVLSVDVGPFPKLLKFHIEIPK